MRFLRHVAFALALSLACASGALAADCAGGAGAKMKVDGKSVGLSAYLSTKPASVSVGRPFQAVVSVCGANGQALERFTIDATMPRHRHGMNYAPKVQSSAQTYTATGMFFHMPGLWRFHVSVGRNGQRQRFIHDVTVE